MDNPIQIKNNLITYIQNSTDLNFLNALQTIFDNKNQNFKLSLEQIKAINKIEIDKGDYIENSKVLNDIKEWLKE